MRREQGQIITFYSWKGGAGRTMALANVASQLVRMGNDVLMIDWDLEAPGLDRYFTNDEAVQKGNVSTRPAGDQSGLIGLLTSGSNLWPETPASPEWANRLWTITIPAAEPTFRVATPPNLGRFHLLPSGHSVSGYSAMLSTFSWAEFFAEHQGGEKLEKLRNQLRDEYDFVLIDSRTGLTDSGGVCTIQMPDMLVLVFTSNDESLEGGLNICNAAQRARSEFAYDRAPLVIMPLLSRWDGDNEVDLGKVWMERFNELLRPIVSSWLPTTFAPYQLLERTRIPHVGRFSFGEPLPVLTHSLTDTNLPGLSYETLARLIHSRLADAGKVIDPTYEAPKFRSGYVADDDLKLLSLVSESTALHQEISRISRASGPNSVELAKFLRRSGSVLQKIARYAEAEPLLRRALAIDEMSFGPDHPEVATDLNNIAVLLRQIDRLAEAESLYRRALAIDEKSLGLDHPKVATDLNNLAELLHETGRLAEAEPLYRRALAINEKNLGPDHPRVATDLNNLANLLHMLNRLAEAEPLFRRAVEIDEKNFGPDHPDVATDLNNLAQLLSETNRLSEAEQLYRRALAIDEESFGPDHPKVAIRLGNLSELLRNTSRPAEAGPLVRRALAIDEKNFGSDHPRIAIKLNNLALLLRDANELAEAESFLRRALAIDEKSLGPNHSEVATDLNNLALLLNETNRPAEAEPLFRRALVINEKNLGLDHPKTLTIKANLQEFEKR